eukprot:TRINITY_DN19071_c0_g1_i1.p1 TRINITY_DN19071_c0_g1~~TRINITY_DN19071_c0_g1_i1.p1  ORF type:complete len:207 (-),score=114.99 TRINITY_DN19071_c0_g1_i1:112-732(-)
MCIRDRQKDAATAKKDASRDETKLGDDEAEAKADAARLTNIKAATTGAKREAQALADKASKEADKVAKEKAAASAEAGKKQVATEDLAKAEKAASDALTQAPGMSAEPVPVAKKDLTPPPLAPDPDEVRFHQLKKKVRELDEMLKPALVKRQDLLAKAAKARKMAEITAPPQTDAEASEIMIAKTQAPGSGSYTHLTLPTIYSVWI